MPIQTPSPDIIFKEWIRGLDRKRLEALFKQKNVPLERESISAAEHVKKVEKYVLGRIIVKREPKKGKTVVVSFSKLKKIEFYSFETSKVVAIEGTLKEVSCSECNGTGIEKCKKCGGKGNVKCGYCMGKGVVTCKKCDGKGTITIEIKVKISEKKEKKKRFTIPCPECHGTGKVICPECAGIGLVRCDNCKGSGGFKCKKCEGTGKLYRYEEGPIISKKKLFDYLIFTSEINEEAKKEIITKLKEVESVNISSSRELDEKMIGRKIGYINEQVKKILNLIKKKIKETEKSKSETLQKPIMLYPVTVLYVETPRKKKLTVIGIGSKDKFVVSEI